MKEKKKKVRAYETDTRVDKDRNKTRIFKEVQGRMVVFENTSGIFFGFCQFFISDSSRGKLQDEEKESKMIMNES